jgi:hypothetical protein
MCDWVWLWVAGWRQGGQHTTVDRAPNGWPTCLNGLAVVSRVSPEANASCCGWAGVRAVLLTVSSVAFRGSGVSCRMDSDSRQRTASTSMTLAATTLPAQRYKEQRSKRMHTTVMIRFTLPHCCLHNAKQLTRPIRLQLAQHLEDL